MWQEFRPKQDKIYARHMTGNNSSNEMTALLPVSRYLQLFRRSWFCGVLFILFLSIALILLRADTQHIRSHSAYLEIIGRIHTHIQHLVITSREALRGNEQAFVQLQNNLGQLNYYAALLQQGGEYQQETISTVTALLPDDLFKTFRNTWQIKENRIHLLLKSREALINLSEIIRQINSTNTLLQQKLQELSAELTQTGRPSNQIVVVETVKILAQFITSSLSTLLQGGLQSAGSEQLDRESERVTEMIETFLKGRDWLYSSVSDNRLSSDTLSRIQIHFNGLEDLLRLAQKLTPEITGAWHAVHETFSASEALSVLIREVEQAITEHNGNQRTRITILFYTAAVLATITVQSPA